MTTRESKMRNQKIKKVEQKVEPLRLNMNDFERDEVFISFGLGIEFFVNEACNRTPDHLKLEMCKNVAGADTYPILLMAIDAVKETQAARDITQLESFAQIEKELRM